MDQPPSEEVILSVLEHLKQLVSKNPPTTPPDNSLNNNETTIQKKRPKLLKKQSKLLEIIFSSDEDHEEKKILAIVAGITEAQIRSWCKKRNAMKKRKIDDSVDVDMLIPKMNALMDDFEDSEQSDEDE